MYGKELGIEESSIQQARIILFLKFLLNNLKPYSSSMFGIAPIQKS